MSNTTGTRVGAGVVIFSPTMAEVLLIRYATNGEWGRPGGAVDAGETALAAAIREVREEVGLDLSPLQSDVQLVEWAEGARLVPPSPWVAAGFAVVLPDAGLMEAASLCEPHKHDALEWVSTAELIALAQQLSEGQRSRRVNPFTLSSVAKFVSSQPPRNMAEARAS